MEIWDRHSTKEVILSLEQECAKARNELSCAFKDIEKAQRRLAFCLSAIHNLKHRDIKE